jgi:hypothetical protein
VVPGMARAASTSAAALSGVTPHCESSSHIGRTASGSYKGCILNPPFCSCALCGALAKHPFLLVPRRDHKSLISITMRATLGYFILWNCAIKWANRLPAALGCAFMTRIPLFFPSPTGFTLPERLISRRPAGIKQKNSGGALPSHKGFMGPRARILVVFEYVPNSRECLLALARIVRRGDRGKNGYKARNSSRSRLNVTRIASTGCDRIGR